VSVPREELGNFIAGQSIPVPVKAIEKQLSELWRGLAESAEAGAGSQPVTRACLWNLIIRTAGGGAFTETKRLVDEISPSLPARVLVLSADAAGGATPIQAWIEANWHGGGKHQIGSEEVTLQAGGDAVDDLAPVVRALILPDVPVAALWKATRPAPEGAKGDALDDELLAAADRVVVATDGAEENVRALGQLATSRDAPAGTHGRMRPHAELVSLPWLRATLWRQLVASLFDAPTTPDEVRAVRSVTVRCPADRVDAALLFIGWLASRLGWTGGRRTGERTYALAGPDGAVTATVEAGVASDDVFAEVELTTEAGPYSVARTGGAVVLNTPEIARKQPRHVPREIDLWLDALGARGRDPLFVAALRVASQLAA
jgi:glucose-6-phosphate dehydrogenase assembly protein OpcA